MEDKHCALVVPPFISYLFYRNCVVYTFSHSVLFSLKCFELLLTQLFTHTITSMAEAAGFLTRRW